MLGEIGCDGKMAEDRDADIDVAAMAGRVDRGADVLEGAAAARQRLQDDDVAAPLAPDAAAVAPADDAVRREEAGLFRISLADEDVAAVAEIEFGAGRRLPFDAYGKGLDAALGR